MIKCHFKCRACNSRITNMYEIAICDACGADLLVTVTDGDGDRMMPSVVYIGNDLDGSVTDLAKGGDLDLCVECYKKVREALGLDKEEVENDQT